jgi:peroxiredoxin
MKRDRTPGEFSKPVAAERSAACWLGVFVAIALVLLQPGPVSAEGSASQGSIIGSAAADFMLRDIEGHQVRLSDFRGKTVLLAFWATWCPPCKEELPMLQKIYEQYEDKDLVILTVDDEEPETIKDFLRANHYSFQALVDNKRVAFREFAVHFIPTAIVINPDEIVTQVVTGWEGPQRLLEALRAEGFGNVVPAPAQPASPGNLQRTLLHSVRRRETSEYKVSERQSRTEILEASGAQEAAAQTQADRAAGLAQTQSEEAWPDRGQAVGGHPGE